jgi:hypothetical protein
VQGTPVNTNTISVGTTVHFGFFIFTDVQMANWARPFCRVGSSRTRNVPGPNDVSAAAAFTQMWYVNPARRLLGSHDGI